MNENIPAKDAVLHSLGHWSNTARIILLLNDVVENLGESLKIAFGKSYEKRSGDSERLLPLKREDAKEPKSLGVYYEKVI